MAVVTVGCQPEKMPLSPMTYDACAEPNHKKVLGSIKNMMPAEPHRLST